MMKIGKRAQHLLRLIIGLQYEKYTEFGAVVLAHLPKPMARTMLSDVFVNCVGLLPASEGQWQWLLYLPEQPALVEGVKACSGKPAFRDASPRVRALCRMAIEIYDREFYPHFAWRRPVKAEFDPTPVICMAESSLQRQLQYRPILITKAEFLSTRTQEGRKPLARFDKFVEKSEAAWEFLARAESSGLLTAGMPDFRKPELRALALSIDTGLGPIK